MPRVGDGSAGEDERSKIEELIDVFDRYCTA